MSKNQEQDQKQKPADSGDAADAKSGDGGKKMAKKGDDLKAEMDELLDEIDAVLEENAEEFGG